MPEIIRRRNGLHFHIRIKDSFIVFVSSEFGTLSLTPKPAHSKRNEATTVIAIPTTINPFWAFSLSPNCLLAA